MKLFAYRGHEPNFGDELNHWLMPKVFPNFFDDDDSVLFLGIGSTLYDYHPQKSQKLVFGTGYGGYTLPPKLDDSWKVFCVRGPQTAKALGLGVEYVAGDAAIMIKNYRAPRRKDARTVSFMPHFESIKRGHWELACKFAGIKFIDPRRDVSDILESLETSKYIITEAMHGAIVADALRVPWIAILPVDKAHWMKWQDWAAALEMNVKFTRVFPSSGREAYLRARGSNYPRRSIQIALRALDIFFILGAAFSLCLARMRVPKLSTDEALEKVIQRLNKEATHVRDYVSSSA